MLDEILCNSRAILESLTKLAVRFERHLARFEPGTLDQTWLPLVGSKGWILLTGDKRIRYNLLEKRIKPPVVASITRTGEVHVAGQRTE